MSDSDGPAERLNSKSSFSCGPSLLKFATLGFFGLGDLSLPRWREKSKSRSIEDSASVSLAEETAVQPVAELPLLSDELDERWPSPRCNEGSTCRRMFSSLQPHLRFIPFDVGERWTEDPVG